jgi:hypothetical protein
MVVVILAKVFVTIAIVGLLVIDVVFLRTRLGGENRKA